MREITDGLRLALVGNQEVLLGETLHRLLAVDHRNVQPYVDRIGPENNRVLRGGGKTG